MLVLLEIHVGPLQSTLRTRCYLNERNWVNLTWCGKLVYKNFSPAQNSKMKWLSACEASTWYRKQTLKKSELSLKKDLKAERKRYFKKWIPPSSQNFVKNRYLCLTKHNKITITPPLHFKTLLFQVFPSNCTFQL